MMENKTICKNKDMALAIIKTLTGGMKAGTQKAALESVAAWLQGNIYLDGLPDSPEERAALRLKIKTGLRNSMTNEERRAEAAFYLGTDDFHVTCNFGCLASSSDCIPEKNEREELPEESKMSIEPEQDDLPKSEWRPTGIGTRR